jgi:hypothetical protein
MELWPSCIGFRNFAVNEVHVGSIPIGHLQGIETLFGSHPAG